MPGWGSAYRRVPDTDCDVEFGPVAGLRRDGGALRDDIDETASHDGAQILMCFLALAIICVIVISTGLALYAFLR